MAFLEVSVNGIDFTQEERQRLALVGASGSGKSTLLKIIAGFHQPDSGSVRFQGRRVLGPDEHLIAGHPGIAYLSQHFELRNNYRVEEVLSYANEIGDASRIFEVCRITDLLKRRTDQLSGGEKQRIALARLLIGRPRLLLLDEPYSNLDLIHTAILRSVVAELEEEMGITILLVSHDPHDTLGWADEIMVLREGGIIQTGPPAEVYRKPVDEYTGGLLGSYNLLPGDLFIRPSDLRFTDQGIEGTVGRISFLGDSYDVAVQTAKGLLTVNVRDCDFSPGDGVRVSTAPGAGWFLPKSTV
jgi:ABC-type sugar transport system ATPase subunit